MRIFKFWIEHSKELDIKGTKQLSKVFGGSNLSKADALNDAENKLIKAQKIINGEIDKDLEYESDILEEIIETIDTDNIITRNRYGALVLNSKKMMFIDIDTYSKSIFEMLFGKKLSLKELMLKRIEKTIHKDIYTDMGFRIYETCKGYRVLITNKSFYPRSKESKKIMQDFNADRLYRYLCTKQNCYRARLTPKPYRIKQKRIKVLYPNRTERQDSILSNWIREYENVSNRFSTCRLVKEFGNVEMNSVIEYHDRLTKIQRSDTLA